MNRLLLRSSLLTASIVLFASTSVRVSAAVITPVSQSRYVSAHAYDTSTTSAPDFGTFNQNQYLSFTDPILHQTIWGRASQYSMIGDSSITCTNYAAGVDTGNGTAYFSLTFQIATQCSFSLSGSDGWINDTLPPLGNHAMLTFTGPSGWAYSSPNEGYGSNGGYFPFSTNGVLDAGQYTITANDPSGNYHMGNHTESFSLQLTPVPEPTAMALLGLAVPALLLNIRRRRPL